MKIHRTIITPGSKDRRKTESMEIIGTAGDPILGTTVLDLLSQEHTDGPAGSEDHVAVRVTVTASDGSQLIYALHTPEVGELAEEVEDWAHHIHQKLVRDDVSEQEIRLWHKMMESDPNWKPE